MAIAAPLREAAGWHATHADHFGQERWEDLSVALQRDHEHLCYLNPFLPAPEQDVLKTDYSLQQTSVPGAFQFQLPDDPDSQFRVVDASEEALLLVEPVRTARHEVEVLRPDPDDMVAPFVFAEAAYLIVALAVQAEEGHHVLDASAGTGVTPLVLASALFSRRCGRGASLPPDLQGCLVCNEVSKARANRLKDTIQSLLPQRLFHAARHGYEPRVLFTSVDLGTPSNAAERLGPYDRILLHPPCTNDRNLVRGKQGGSLTKWTSATSKVSSERQLKWLFNALWLLKEGGVLVFFSTALAYEECDGVVERLLTKIRGTFEVEVLPVEESICSMVPGLAHEATDWGVRIMPDRTSFGPLYFSRIRMLGRSQVR